MHPSGPSAGPPSGSSSGPATLLREPVAPRRHRRRRRRRVRLAAALGALLLAGAGGYAAADAADLVPGVLTTEPLPVADPLPVAPGTAMVLAPPGALYPSTIAPVPDPAAVVAVLAPLLADPALGPSVGASVIDAATGQVLLDAGAGDLREPASTAKLLTAAAALHRLGGTSTRATRVVTGAALGQVVLVGGGDVLLAEGAGNPGDARGRAGLGDLAAATASALRPTGTTTVTVLVVVALTGAAPQVSPAWSPTDLTSGFVAPLTALAVDAGRLAPQRYAPRAPDPALAAAGAFAARLREQGITVVGEPVRGAAPQGAAALAEVRSAPLSDVIALMLAESDNTVADAVAHLVAVDPGSGAAAGPGAGPGSGPGSGPWAGFPASGAAVLAAVAELGVDVDGAVLLDGSGLGEGSRVPAAALSGVLAVAASPEDGGVRDLLAALPVAGLTGTLAGRFRAEDAAGSAVAGVPPPPGPGAGVVRAKTGSLLGVTSLAGSVVDADGRQLVFAVVADHVTASDPARRAVDAYATALAGCSCR